MWDLVAETWKYLTVPAIGLLIGLVLFAWGMWGSRARGCKRCPKCWYDMSGAPGLTCSECGKTVRTPRGLLRNRRRWWAVVLAIVLTIPGVYMSTVIVGYAREYALRAMEERGRGTVYADFTTVGPAWLVDRLPEQMREWYLRIVDLTLISDVTDADVRNAARLSHLQALLVLEAAVSSEAFAHFSDLRDLKSFRASGAAIDDEVLRHISGCDNLERLSLNSESITDAGMAHLAELTALRELQLTGTKLTDAGLRHLRGMTQLTDLALYRVAVTDRGMEDLASLEGLKHLRLLGTQVRGPGLVHLASLAELRTLVLRNSPTDDEGLADIAALTRLRSLSLQGTQITDAAIDTIAGIESLRSVNITDTAVTEEGIARLREMRPGLAIPTPSRPR